MIVLNKYVGFADRKIRLFTLNPCRACSDTINQYANFAS